MATLKQAKEWLEEGKKIFKKSEPEHIYSRVNGEDNCSCGREVDWNETSHYARDWEIHTKKNAKEEILDMCPDCGNSLDGNYCNSCSVKWEFAKSKESVKE